MICQCCSTPLIPATPGEFQCPEEFCVANNLRALWNTEGELHFPALPDGVKIHVAHKIVEKFSKFSNI